MDAVAASFGADIDHGLADAARSRIEDAVRRREAHAHRVDQDVVVVASVEIGLPAHRRHADAIAVIADARDHTRHEMPRLRVIRRAKAQRIQVGNRPSAHGEDVAHDAADPGRCALVRLDIGGMVVALHLENGSEPPAEINDAGILARSLDDALASGRQGLQPDLGGFVGAMLRPHHRENPELGKVRLAPEQFLQALIFMGGEAVAGNDLRGDRS